MAWFQAFRHPEGFSHYPSHRSAVTVDKDFVAVIYVCVLVFLASILTAFGSRGKERRTTVIRVGYSVIVCSVILICLYGHGWQEGQITAKTLYVFRSTEKMNATIGVKMSLISVNITLTGQFGTNKGDVNYNERLVWLDLGQLERDFHEKLVQGLPAPLLTVAEYMSVDVGGFRWGRHFREAGYYSLILLWSSFAFWIVTIILMCSVVFFGSVMFILSGVMMCATVVIYHLLQPISPFRVPFDKQVLVLHYSWSYWLLLVTGILTTILGFMTLVFNCMKPKETAIFFGLENELCEIDDLCPNSSRSLEVVDYSLACPRHSSHSDPGYEKNDCADAPQKWVPLPETKPDSKDDTNMVASDSPSCLDISSIDRKMGPSRIVCVTIPDGIELFRSDDTFKLPIEEPGSKLSHREIGQALTKNKDSSISTRF